MSQRNRRVAEHPENSISEITLNYCGTETVRNSSMAQGAPETERSEECYKEYYEEYLEEYFEEYCAGDNLTLTWNGAPTYVSSGSALVDFDAGATKLRFANADKIREDAASAYKEDALLAVKLFFQTGDIRGGKGERRIFQASMDFLCESHPLVALEVLPLIPEYTRWDYLVRLSIGANEQVSREATRLVVEQFKRDLAAAADIKEGETAHISLLGKWMPSLQTKKAENKAIVRHFLKALSMKERDYRHALSSLRAHLNVIEKYMSSNESDQIDMEKMTAKQQLRYSAFLNRVMKEKRHAYIQAVMEGHAKMNASVLNPVEICHEYIKTNTENDRYGYRVRFDEVVEDLEALWSLLPDVMSGNGNTLVVRDGSGSMCAHPAGKSSATMLDAATALAIYCAERLSGPFRNKFITFSNHPELVDLSDCQSLLERLYKTYSYDECSNTDIEATFDLILDAAVAGRLSQEELPAYLLILSDMEFDMARELYSGETDHFCRKTLFQTIRNKWNRAGYQVPTLVYWNLNALRTTFPEIDSENGVIYLSGFSTSELALVMAGEYEKLSEVTLEETIVDALTGEKTVVTKTIRERVVLSPEMQLTAKLSNTRYDAVEQAVLRGISSESA